MAKRRSLAQTGLPLMLSLPSPTYGLFQSKSANLVYGYAKKDDFSPSISISQAGDSNIALVP